jgi:hypothetical protein
VTCCGFVLEEAKAMNLHFPRAVMLLSMLLPVLRAVTLGSPDSVPPGSYGGEHVIMEVSKRGATFEFDCAHGETHAPLVLDKQGNFNVSGTFTAEHGGPVREDEVKPPNPSSYSGHLEGDNLILNVKVKDQQVGTFNLVRDAHPLLRKCR